MHIHIFISIEALSIVSWSSSLFCSLHFCIYIFLSLSLLVFKLLHYLHFIASICFLQNTFYLFVEISFFFVLLFIFCFCFCVSVALFLHFLHIISFRFISISVVFAWRASSIIDPSYLVSNFFHHILCIVYIAFFANHLLSLSIFFLCFFIALFFLHFFAQFFFLQNTFSLFLYIWLLFVCCTSFSRFCFFCTTCLFTFYIFLFIFVSVSIC